MLHNATMVFQTEYFKWFFIINNNEIRTRVKIDELLYKFDTVEEIERVKRLLKSSIVSILMNEYNELTTRF